ncbi:hypothetical protein X975_21367, partial [Stegodyphus mimosarum]
MVMEASTLSTPQRKYNPVPVQKSLSLPSYARASGEGIDHRLIFAALEQKEKVRRKSRIFAREKTARQSTIFCLPISSGAKCKETSLSSDTSCSSLEYQKPKPALKTKKDIPKDSETKPKNEPLVNETINAKTSRIETKSSQDSVCKDEPTKNEFSNSLKVQDQRKGYRSAVDHLRPNVGSSDSMERSSRSSSDSLSRKERLVAIKARVEAAREKYGDTSSEEETRTSITRYNSDGVIHRTVREVKSKSSRLEKRIRRRSHGSQDQWPSGSSKRAHRKQNLSLCINSPDDGVKTPSGSLDINNDFSNLECKTDFCPSPNFPDLKKNYYFSDFPSKENAARIVQTRIKHIEEEERKRRSGSDFREKTKLSPHQSPQNVDTSSPFSTINRNQPFNQNSSSYNMDKSGHTDVVKSSSPVPKSPQPPTPPPRSPKSMTFVNKAFIQHQNVTYFGHENNSLERKVFFQPNIQAVSHTRLLDRVNSKSEAVINDPKSVNEMLSETSEKQKIRELLSSRRKTCGNFDFVDTSLLNDLSPSRETTAVSKPILMVSKNIVPPAVPIRCMENKGYFSSSETPHPTSESTKNKLLANKWDENEKRREFMFNSLESKKKNPYSWLRWQTPPKNEICFCRLISGEKFSCTCHPTNDKIYVNTNFLCSENSSKITNSKEVSALSTHCPKSRLSKSELNIAMVEKSNPTIQNIKIDESGSLKESFLCTKDNSTTICPSNSASATANLDSAMEELESVYRSLKFSSDNLSERNSISNVSDEEGIKKSSKPSCESELKVSFHNDDLTLQSFKNPNDKLYPQQYNKSFIELKGDESQLTSKNRDLSNNAFSIDELFNDLTRQLDIEQKLLKESRDGKNQNHSNSCQLNKCESFKHKTRPSPLESIVSIRKEIYNNLQKSSVDQSQNLCLGVKDDDTHEGAQAALAKKKYKAVRSLSANISYLMATANSDSVGSTRTNSLVNSELAAVKAETNSVEKSPNHYEHPALEPAKTEIKSVPFPSSRMSSSQTSGSSEAQNQKTDEIRHIRVSMDSSVSHSPPIIKNSLVETKQYPRLSSAICGSQTSPKLGVPKRMPRDITSSSSVAKETIDILDESGLEKLLNTLLNEVPEPKQSSLLRPKERGPATPPPVAADKFENVKFNRNLSSSKMDVYVATKAKNDVSSSKCNPRNLRPEENAQKFNTDLRQNNNAHGNQTSFIPVFTKKADMCHNFSRKTEAVNRDRPKETAEQIKNTFAKNSPDRQNSAIDQIDKIPVKHFKTHMRRRSVGFEDMTSLNIRYGHNFANDNRFNRIEKSCNFTSRSGPLRTTFVASENDIDISREERNKGGSSCSPTRNENVQLAHSENENDPLHQRNAKPYKDKSSKRKSSLNRIDFINFSPSSGENAHYRQENIQNKRSSSDEQSETKSLRPNAEFLSSASKRKHNSSCTAAKAMERKVSEGALPNSMMTNSKMNLLPETLQDSRAKFWRHRWNHSASLHLKKISYSADELETLADFPKAPVNTISLSAQELDVPESLSLNNKEHILKSSQKLLSNKISKNNDCNADTSQSSSGKQTVSEYVIHVLPHERISPMVVENEINFDSTSQEKENLSINSKIQQMSNEINSTFQNSDTNENVEFKDKENGSCGNDDSELTKNTIKMENLEISTEKSFVSYEPHSPSDDSGSDGEKRPSSILRKKISEEKKELHGILKPPTDDKMSKTPPSILKHRESSEEKDVWPQTDLHSILKKSTSEDESCNSGPDIRPILKVSTDEESPVGSVRPRPILKKRTSFSDECSYASFPSGELKPILKKKTPLALEEQPRPILKSRRKSEDTRSTSELITSRPRAYSADMGVKSNHEARLDGLELKKDDFTRHDYHDL